MKYKIVGTSAFKKELKLIKKRHKDLEKLGEVVNKLSNGEVLDEKLETIRLLIAQDLKIVENVI